MNKIPLLVQELEGVQE